MSFEVSVNNALLVPQSEVKVERDNVGGQILNVNIQATDGPGPYGVAVSGGKNEIEFNLGSANCAMIPAKSFLEFDLSMGTTGVCAGSVDAVFDRVRIINQAGNALLDEQASNVFSRIKQIALISNENASLHWEENLDQLCHADSGQTVFTTTKVRHIVKLKQAFWTQVKALPLPIMGNIRLVLTMAKDTQAFSVMPSGQYYRVDNPVFVEELLPYTLEYLEKVRRLALAGGVLLNYTQTAWVNAPVANAGINTVTAQFKANSIRSLIAVHRFRANDTHNTYEKLGKYQIPNQDATQAFSIYVSHGGQQYPSTAIQSYPRAYKYLKQVMNIDNDLDAGNQITRALYSAVDNTSTNQSSLAPRFIVGIRLDNGLNNGLSTKDSAIQYVLEQTSSVAGLSVDLFIQYDYSLIIKSPMEHYPIF